MRIAYNPKTAQALYTVPDNDDITFDLSGLTIYTKGVGFKGTDTTYSVFKKHTSENSGGYDGLVPVPSYTETNIRFLKEDGTWSVPSYTDTSDKITALTNYIKASLIGAISLEDSLNSALGKLEYKADVTYDLLTSINSSDTKIETLQEILKVLEGISDTDTIKELLGKYLLLSGGTIHGHLSVGDKTTTSQYLLSVQRNSLKLSLLISGANEGWIKTTYESGNSTALILNETTGLLYKDVDDNYHTLAVIGDIPTKLSQLTNDTNFVTGGPYLPLSGGIMIKGSLISWGSGSEGNDIDNWDEMKDKTGITVMSSVGSTGSPCEYSTGLHVKGRYGFQLASGGGETDSFYIRNISRDSDWKAIIHSGNISDYLSNISVGDADTLDGKHASDFMEVSGGNITGATVADVKANLLKYFKDKPATTNAYTSSTFVDNFTDDSYKIQSSSVCGWIALNPGYNNYDHGHFLVSEYGSNRLRHVGLGYNTWYGPYTIAYLSDIPTVTNYYWANVKVSASSSDTTTPTFGGATVNGQIDIVTSKHITSTVDPASSAIMLGSSGAGHTGYHAGIAFNALRYIPYINHIHAWIGLGPYTTTEAAECYPLIFATNGSTTTGDAPTERMRITPDGNIGVGTTSPRTALDVYGTDAAVIIGTTNGDYGKPEARKLRLGLATAGHTGSQYWHFTTDDTTGNAYLQIHYGASDTGISIRHDGCLGVGTNFPSQKLEVDGTVKATSLMSSNIRIECDNDGIFGARGNEINNYNSHLYLNYASSTNVIMANGGGKVGIGTTSPTQKLSVNGAIYTMLPSTNRQAGIIGTYDPNRAAAIWSMGSAYQIAADGLSLGNLYGAAYVFYGPGYTLGAGKSGGHSFVWAQNGTPTAALGDNVWTSGVLETESYLTFGYLGALFTTDIRSTWRQSLYGNTANDSRFRTVRTDVTIADFSEIYGSGITWATADTQGYLSVSHSGGKAFIGGGDGNTLNWSYQLLHSGNYSSIIDSYYIKSQGMMNSAYATIPTYNGETGWHRIATINGGVGYGSYILYLCGDWSYASNTNAIIHIDTMYTTAQLTQVSGIVGYVSSVRLVNVSNNQYYVDVYINYSGANTPGIVYCYFLGNGTITPRTTAEKITASVTAAAEIALQSGGRANNIVVHNSDSNSTYRMVWHSGNTLYSTGGIYCNPSTDYLYATSMNASDWFRSSGNTGWYNPTNNCHVYPNAATTYGGLMLRGEKGGYTGFILGTSTDYMNLMDNSNDKGLYQEGKGWILYYNRSYNQIGLLTNDLADAVNVAGIIRSTANSRYLRLGPQNSSHAHYETNADVSHWFNKMVEVDGVVRPYRHDSYTCGASGNRWSNVYSTDGNFSGVVETAGRFRAKGGSDTFVDLFLNSNGNTVLENSSGGFYINSKNLLSFKSSYGSTSYLLVFSASSKVFYPNESGISLGTSDKPWGNIYGTLKGDADTVDDMHASQFIHRLPWWTSGNGNNIDNISNGTTFAYTDHNAPTNGVFVAFSGTHNSYLLQLQGEYHGRNLYFRNKNGDNGTWNAWSYVIHDGNIGSQSVNYANSAGNTDTVDGYHIWVGSSLPATKTNNTIYIVI